MNAGREKASIGDALSAQVAVAIELCKTCGICIALCPESVFDSDDRGYPIVARPDDCTSCLLCEFHCPDFAIEVQRRPKKRSAATPEAIAEAASDRVAAAIAGGSSKARGSGDEGSADECDPHGEED
jgi:2-oxoglutarate ferredoxin oxidoreductase subunit delta